ncbi:MAG: hypothetical protein ACOZF0_01770 [Thermodesulfobacteriota bacterium]
MDAGDFFWSQEEPAELRAEFTARALKMLGYDAMNVADGELGYGLPFLQRFRDSIQPGFIGSNTFVGKEYAWKPYHTKTVNGVKIGVVGVVSAGFTDPARTGADGIEVRDMVSSLKAVLPALKKETGLVVLLSHAGWDESVRLANEVDGIDVIIVGHQYYYDFEPAVVHGKILLKSSMGGKHVGVIRIWLDRNGKIERQESFLKELTPSVASDPEFDALEKEFETQRNLAKRRTSGNR